MSADKKISDEAILNSIIKFALSHNYYPTFREIGDLVGLTSTSSVHSRLKSMEKKGLLTCNAQSPRCMNVPGLMYKKYNTENRNKDSPSTNSFIKDKGTKTRRQIYDAIEEYMLKNNVSPSVREICAMTGKNSTSTIKAQLDIMKERKMLDFNENSPRTLKLPGIMLIFNPINNKSVVTSIEPDKISK